jgi:hypothetical protein
VITHENKGLNGLKKKVAYWYNLIKLSIKYLSLCRAKAYSLKMLPTIDPASWKVNVQRGGIFVYWPSLRSEVRQDKARVNKPALVITNLEAYIRPGTLYCFHTS